MQINLENHPKIARDFLNQKSMLKKVCFFLAIKLVFYYYVEMLV